uniref:Uncharacterized protein n=1 Tax=Calidris pygmaea TaxID=425635 RepID=A0A8C3JMC4_9CHAR
APAPLEQLVPEAAPEALDLLRRFLRYPSGQRIRAHQVGTPKHGGGTPKPGGGPRRGALWGGPQKPGGDPKSQGGPQKSGGTQEFGETPPSGLIWLPATRGQPLGEEGLCGGDPKNQGGTPKPGGTPQNVRGDPGVWGTPPPVG